MILSFRGKTPDIDENTFIAANATIAGEVKISEGSTVWYGAVIRGDGDAIEIGENTNVQDNCVLHTDAGYKMVIGSGVTIGHGAIVHGAVVGDNTLIGMGAILLNGCRVGKDCLIGAGAVVCENQEIPDGSLVVGSPAVVKKPLTQSQIQGNRASADHYREFGMEFKKAEEAQI